MVAMDSMDNWAMMKFPNDVTLQYTFYIISWNVNSRTCQLANSKVSIGYSFITLNT